MKYWFCNGTSLESVNVTMQTTACVLDANYDDGYNVYRTYKNTITFTLSNSIAVDIYPRFSYRYKQYINYELVNDTIHQATGFIPAGSTVGVLQWTCKEERWDNNGFTQQGGLQQAAV